MYIASCIFTLLIKPLKLNIMKKQLLILPLVIFFLYLNGISQCGQISLIGEFNGWADDHFLDQDPLNPDLYSTFISLNEGDDASDPLDGIIEMKFRENADWMVNWGSEDFPNGVGIQDGPNIPVPYNPDGLYTTYFVSFNCVTGEYSFEETCGNISLIGEFSEWAGDHFMERDSLNHNLFSTIIYITLEDDISIQPDGIVEMKFRENADWAVNWGDEDFPEGIGIQDGPDIPVPYNNWQDSTGYIVTFNCLTLEYNFQDLSCGLVSIIGEFNGWESDLDMEQDSVSPNIRKVSISFTDQDDTNSDGIIELKFRNNHDWEVCWGGDDFPSGTGYQGGPNIHVPVSSYDVKFNCETFEYDFVETSSIYNRGYNHLIILAPNPTKEIVTIRSTNGFISGWVKISINDMLGRVILVEKDILSYQLIFCN